MRKGREIILVGDRVLIDPAPGDNKTPGGLYLPPGVKEKERIQGGYVVKTGPGFPLPHQEDEDTQPWEQSTETPRYLPLQAEAGDYALFLRKSGVEIELDEKTYIIVPYSAMLVLIRDEFMAP